MAKFVEVIKEVVVIYRVDGAPTDDEAVEIVKRRMEADAPLDIIKETSKTVKMRVKDTE